ncbi:MAG: hypothetical protein DME45_09120 [Verrucomicrobia bacterium]|nr:MAG: hypothetical protein DME45_09120 [Verrucomicrobiota bacterium]
MSNIKIRPHLLPLKEHRKAEEQQSTIAILKSAVAAQSKQIQSLNAAVQKLSNHMEGNEPGQ